MGARFSKVSCSCTINCHQHPAVHDHTNGVASCQRCTHLRRLRAGAESRASAASTSTEYLARPRYYASPSPDPELARHLLPNPSLLRQRAPAHHHRARHTRALSYPDTLSSLSTTPGPTSTPSGGSLLYPSSSTALNRTPSLPSSVMRRVAAENLAATDPRHIAAAGRGGSGSGSWGYVSDGDDSNIVSRNEDVHGAGLAEIVVATPSDISRSSTVAWQGSEGSGSVEGASVYSQGG